MDSKEPELIELTFWDQHRLLLMIFISIVITLALTFISMTLYYRSGASQLDLSRPGYQGVSSQINRDESSFQNYSSVGPINQDAINEFKNLYTTQSDKAITVDAFSGDPLDPEALGISE